MYTMYTVLYNRFVGKNAQVNLKFCCFFQDLIEYCSFLII